MDQGQVAGVARPPYGWRSALRGNLWLTRVRLRGWSRVLLAMQLAGALLLASAGYGLLGRQRVPLTTDFISFYAAGRLADGPAPAAAYDQAKHRAEEEALIGKGVEYRFFFYPPIFLALCALLAKLPYLVAFAAFEGGGLVLYLLAVRLILGRREPGWLIAAGSFPALFWTIGIGQNALLTAGLFGLGTWLLRRRPAAGGAVLALLAYKPHFGLLLPVAFLAGRQWRAFAGAAAGLAALVLLSGEVLGWHVWVAFWGRFVGAPATFATGRISYTSLITPYGAARLLGLAQPASDAAQLVATVIAAVAVGVIWRRGASLPVRAAALVAATLLAVPVALFYDLTLTAIAIAWLARDRAHALPYEGVLLGFVVFVAMAARGAAIGLSVPLGPLACAALLALCFVRATLTGESCGLARIIGRRWPDEGGRRAGHGKTPSPHVRPSPGA